MKFWDRFEGGFSCLAPMEGVTDVVFRKVVERAGRPDVYFTEFTNVNSFASDKGRANALERLRYLPGEMPIVAQIWGVNPEYFEVTVNGLREMGYEAVDVNMGCPERHVVGNSLVPTLVLTVFYVSTFRRMCAVPNVAVFCSSRTAWLPGMLLRY